MFACCLTSGKLLQLDRMALREHLPILLMFIIDGNVTVQKSKLFFHFLPFILNFGVHLLIIGSCTFLTYIGDLYLATIFLLFSKSLGDLF